MQASRVSLDVRTFTLVLCVTLIAALLVGALAPVLAYCDAQRVLRGRHPLFCWLRAQDLQGGDVCRGVGYIVAGGEIHIPDDPTERGRRSVFVSFLFPGAHRFDYSILPPPRPAKLTSREALHLASTVAKETWPDFSELVSAEPGYDGVNMGGTWFVCWQKPLDHSAPASDCTAAALVRDKTGRVTLVPRAQQATSN